MPNFISEDDIEQEILKKLKHEFGYELLNCFTVDAEDLNDRSGRTDKRDVILADRLKDALIHLNPGIPEPSIDEALSKLTDKRHAMSPVAANRELDALIRGGVPVEFDNSQGQKENARVYAIDFNQPKENRFLAVSQLWIKGERYRRPDILLYVNGLPLVFIELKNSNVPLRTAFEKNLIDYRKDIPQLYLTNAFCILSNAIETKVGSSTAEWEHFFNWLRVEDEKEKVDRARIREEGTSVELAVAGLCPKENLLDYFENFIIYHGETEKIIAQKITVYLPV